VVHARILAIMDHLDRQIVHALQVDGRAPFSRIATVLGVSDQTVARRYRALRQAGVVKVIGSLSAERAGRTQWAIRLHCAPGSSLAVATALAKREDTYWVRLASGGTEILCHVRTGSTQDRDALLLDKLAATRPISAISAHCVLHTFYGGAAGWQGVTSALTEEQVTAIAQADPKVTDTDASALGEGDRPLLEILAQDGRTTHADLAASTGWHESTVRRRIAQLRSDGTLYFDLDVDPVALGYEMNCVLWISVEPAHLATVGAALAEHPEVPFAVATTGPTNLMASVVTTDTAALYTYLTDRIGVLPGIREVRTAPIIRTVKRAGAVAWSRNSTDPR
jgi:DNA-binding Lrp family transcriptional regulator